MRRRLLARLLADIIGTAVFTVAAAVCAMAAIDPTGGAMVGDRAIALGMSGFLMLVTWALFADGSAVVDALTRRDAMRDG